MSDLMNLSWDGKPKTPSAVPQIIQKKLVSKKTWADMLRQDTMAKDNTDEVNSDAVGFGWGGTESCKKADWGATSDAEADDRDVKLNVEPSVVDSWLEQAEISSPRVKVGLDEGSTDEHLARMQLGLKCLTAWHWEDHDVCRCASHTHDYALAGIREHVMVKQVVKHRELVRGQSEVAAAAQGTGKAASTPVDDTIYTPPETVEENEPAVADPLLEKENSDKKQFSAALDAISSAVEHIKLLELTLSWTRDDLNAQLRHAGRDPDMVTCDSFSRLGITVKSKVAIQSIKPAAEMALKELSKNATVLNSVCQPCLQDITGMIDFDDEAKDADKIKVSEDKKIGKDKKDTTFLDTW